MNSFTNEKNPINNEYSSFGNIEKQGHFSTIEIRNKNLIQDFISSRKSSRNPEHDKIFSKLEVRQRGAGYRQSIDRK